MGIRRHIPHGVDNERGSTVAQSAALALAAIVILGALYLVVPNMRGSVDRSFSCLIGAISGGGGGGCVGAGAATQAPPPAAEKKDDCGFFCQAGGVFKGIGEGVVDTVTGVGTLVVDGVKYAAGDEETRAKYAALVEAFKEDPLGTTKALAEAMVEPMVTDWQEGRYGEAIGRGIFEVVSTVGGPKGLDKLGKLSKVDDIARVAGKVDELGDAVRVAGKADELGDAARIGNRVPCIGAAPAGKAPGLAKPLASCRIGDDVKRLPDDKIEVPPKRGDAPLSVDDGKPVEIHHVDQNPDGPFVELSRTDHRGKGNFKDNHPNTGQEPSKIDRREWRRMVDEYWREEWDRGRFKKLPPQDPTN